MKKIIMFGLLSLMLLFLIGCGANDVSNNVDDASLDTELEDVQEKDETIYKEQKGILTDTITFGEGDSFYGKIKKHKTSKTAEIEAWLYSDLLADSLFDDSLTLPAFIF